MKLRKVRVTHFRGIKEVELNLRNYTTIIGPNNTCKSSALRAIELFLDQGKPAKEDWHELNFQENIEVEGVFEDLQDWEKKKSGVASLVQNNQIRLRMLATYEPKSEKVETKYEAFIASEFIPDLHEKTWTTLPNEIQQIAKDMGFTGKNWSTKSNLESIKEVLREKHPDKIQRSDPDWTSEGISIKEALKQALPQVVIIPASLNVTEELKNTGKTAFGKLLEQIVMPALKGTVEFNEFEKSIEKLINKVKGHGTEKIKEVDELSRDLSERMNSILAGTKVSLTLTPPEVSKVIGGGATVKVNDGVETEVERQGHGAQRSLIFALIEVLAKKTASSRNDRLEEEIRSTVLLFEEPELYLHPHLMRRLKSALETISSSGLWQTICTTHSPFLIDVASDPLSLIIFQKNEKRDFHFRQLDEDPFEKKGKKGEREKLRALLDFHPTVCESFFGKQVVLVEGDTEVAVFSVAKNLLSQLEIDSIKHDNTTVVSCDGKWTIAPIALLLRSLGINFKVIHDEDRKGRTEEQLKEVEGNDEFKANERILEIVGVPEKILKVQDTFENVLWPDKKPSAKDKPYRAWEEVRRITEEGKILEYNQLVEILRFAFE